jgi:hypothetical protein
MEAIEAANANGNVRGRCFWWRGEWRKLKLTLMGIHRRKSRVVWTEWEIKLYPSTSSSLPVVIRTTIDYWFLNELKKKR